MHGSNGSKNKPISRLKAKIHYLFFCIKSYPLRTLSGSAQLYTLEEVKDEKKGDSFSKLCYYCFIKSVE